MPGYLGKTTNATREVRGVQMQAERESMWGEMTGKVVSFDAAKQTATIQPDYKPLHNGQPIDMPELQEVPMRFPRSGGFIITHPVKVGDKVTLRPQMRTSEQFHLGNEYVADRDTRNHSLSDYEAFLEGGEPLTQPIGGFNSQNMEIRSEGGLPKIELAENGMIRLIIAAGCYIEMSAEGIKMVAPRIDMNPA